MCVYYKYWIYIYIYRYGEIGFVNDRIWYYLCGKWVDGDVVKLFVDGENKLIGDKLIYGVIFGFGKFVLG